MPGVSGRQQARVPGLGLLLLGFHGPLFIGEFKAGERTESTGGEMTHCPKDLEITEVSKTMVLQ